MINVGEYLCPALHGKTAAPSFLEKMCFQSLCAERRLVVPLFQRRYTWCDDTIVRFVSDAILCNAPHSLEKLIFYEVKPASSERQFFAANHITKPTLCAIDGQQRITSCMLLICALRDACVDNDDFVRECNRILFCDQKSRLLKFNGAAPSNAMPVDDNDNESESNNTDDALPEFGATSVHIRFQPTYLDRQAYYTAVLGLAPRADDDVRQRKTIVQRTKALMDRLLQKHLGSLPAADRLERMKAIKASLMNRFEFFSYVIMDDTAGNEVYQWMQQPKMGDFIINKHPGVAMALSDLVRNYLFSYGGMDEEWQMDVFHRFWIPVETVCETPSGLDDFIEKVCSLGPAPNVTAGLPSHVELTENAQICLRRNLRIKQFVAFMQTVAPPTLNDKEKREAVVEWCHELLEMAKQHEKTDEK